jgi:hypothetical protein
MWLRCSRPNDYKAAQYELSTTSRPLPAKLETPCFLAYVKGFSIRLLVRLPKEQATSNVVPRPPAPPGSQAESEEEGEDDPKTKPNWHVIKSRLKEFGWSRTLFDWWKLEKPPLNPYPPRFKKVRSIQVNRKEKGLAVMKEIGIFTLTVPPHCPAWRKQPTIVRRFWRETFIEMCGLSTGLRVAQQDICQLFAYIKKNLPFVWQFARPPQVYVEPGKYGFAQMGFFARLFDIAAKIKRHGLKYLYPRSMFVRARQYCERAHQYAREKYPFVNFNLPVFFGHLLVDSLCNDLWFDDWDSQRRGRVTAENLRRVWCDFFDDDPTVCRLEDYCPRLTDELVHAPVEKHGPGFQKMHVQAVHDALYDVGEPWYNFPVVPRRSKVLINSPYPRYEKRQCDPIFLRIEYRRHLQDPNWIKYPNRKVIFPRRLQALRLSMPAIPLISTEEGELSEVILHCILKDRFFFQQKKWYVRVPVFLLEDDVWYFSSAWYNFDRYEMVIKLSDIMHPPGQ